MSDDLVVRESDTLRVRLVYDGNNDFPDFIEAAIISADHRYTDHNDTFGWGRHVRRAVERYRRDYDLVERYARIFLGVRGFRQVNVQPDSTHFALISTVDIDAHVFGDGAEEIAAADAETYHQWATGHVYGYVIEERAAWGRLNSDGEPRSRLADHDDYRETWEMVEDCYGYYGIDHAEQAALEAYTTHLEHAAKG
ncbi:hypothetical protein [Kribbella deserti]|uniref:Uncharacterized protein n=1 Tax=Kribbella deserti TaxID=1926257 RepID=A0ABV6QDY0_9ACTN